MNPPRQSVFPIRGNEIACGTIGAANRLVERTDMAGIGRKVPDAVSYYRARAARELQKAETVGHRPTARMHRELAKLYEHRADEAEERKRAGQ